MSKKDPFEYEKKLLADLDSSNYSAESLLKDLTDFQEAFDTEFLREMADVQTEEVEYSRELSDLIDENISYASYALEEFKERNYQFTHQRELKNATGKKYKYVKEPLHSNAGTVDTYATESLYGIFMESPGGDEEEEKSLWEKFKDWIASVPGKVDNALSASTGWLDSGFGGLASGDVPFISEHLGNIAGDGIPFVSIGADILNDSVSNFATALFSHKAVAGAANDLSNTIKQLQNVAKSDWRDTVYESRVRTRGMLNLRQLNPSMYKTKLKNNTWSNLGANIAGHFSSDSTWTSPYFVPKTEAQRHGYIYKATFFDPNTAFFSMDKKANDGYKHGSIFNTNLGRSEDTEVSYETKIELAGLGKTGSKVGILNEGNKKKEVNTLNTNEDISNISDPVENKGFAVPIPQSGVSERNQKPITNQFSKLDESEQEIEPHKYIAGKAVETLKGQVPVPRKTEESTKEEESTKAPRTLKNELEFDEGVPNVLIENTFDWDGKDIAPKEDPESLEEASSSYNVYRPNERYIAKNLSSDYNRADDALDPVPLADGSPIKNPVYDDYNGIAKLNKVTELDEYSTPTKDESKVVPIEGYIEGNVQDAKLEEDENNVKLYNMISRIMMDYDAQLQYFVIWFTHGLKDELLEVPAQGQTGRHYYYFYISEVSFKPISFSTTKLSYGAIDTYTRLVPKTKGENKFTMKTSLEIGLSFYNFITQKAMGFNWEKGLFSSTVKNPGNLEEETEGKKAITIADTSKVNMHIMIPSKVTVENESKKYFVNHFILKDVVFTDMDKIGFAHQSNGNVAVNIKGIYRKAYLAHNQVITANK